MAKTDWGMDDTVMPEDMNQIGEEINGKETPSGAQAKADAAQAAANSVASADATSKANAVQTNLTAHDNNTTKHITAAERTGWNLKASTSVATSAVNGLMSAADKSKLDGVATNANNYTHPTNHPPSIIAQDANNRFMTDTERTKLNGIATGANNYVHPANHPPSIITQDANNRFTTDAEKATWSGKANISEIDNKVGTLSTLKTAVKGNTVAAINELFQNVSDGKTVVAAAITGKGQTTAADATFQTMATNIGNIMQGSGNALPAEVLAGKTYANSSGAQVGTMANNGAVTSTLATNGAAYTVPAGYHNGAGKVTASITNLTAANVAKGATVGGVAGTYTADATAIAAQILAGSTAYVNGLKVLGTIPTTIPDYADQILATNISNGQYTGDGKHYLYFAIIANRFMNGVNWIRSYDENFKPENILKGKSVFGMSGNLEVPEIHTSNWIQRTSGLGTILLSAVAIGNGIAVLGGASGNLATSFDGITWTKRTTAFGTAFVRCATFGKGIFVASAGEGLIGTSSDGINWTLRTSGFGTSFIYSIAFGNNMFVAVGANGKLATSLDGITWTHRSSGITENFNSVAAGNGIFIATANIGRVLTSTDGITWTARGSGFGRDPVESVVCGNGMFVIAGYEGMIATSFDGITWRHRSSGFGATRITTVGFGNGLFVAAGNEGKLAASLDGITWTHRVSGFDTSGISAIAFDRGLFVIVGATGKVAQLGTMLTG